MNNEILQSLAEVSNYIGQLDVIIVDLDRYILQYSQFLGRIHDLQIQNNVYLVQDVLGNLELDRPSSMPDATVSELVRRAKVLDSLCITRMEDITSEIEKAKGIEKAIKAINPNYSTKISGQIAEFARLSGAFR